MVSVGQRMFEGMNSFALLAIPLYTFAGFTMSKGGISDRLMGFCYSLVGRFTGGLALSLIHISSGGQLLHPLAGSVVFPHQIHQAGRHQMGQVADGRHDGIVLAVV